ncbi:hypothetical protein [Streptomyces malaysiensis]
MAAVTPAPGKTHAQSERTFQPRYQEGDGFHSVNALAWTITRIHRCEMGDVTSSLREIEDGVVYYWVARPDGSTPFVIATRDLHHYVDFVDRLKSPEATPCAEGAKVAHQLHAAVPKLLTVEIARNGVESIDAVRFRAGEQFLRPSWRPDYWRYGGVDSLPNPTRGSVWTVVANGGGTMTARRNDGHEVTESVPSGAQLLRLPGGGA